MSCCQIVGWAGYVKVDGKAYVFLGAPSVSAEKAVQKSLQVCPILAMSGLSHIDILVQESLQDNPH